MDCVRYISLVAIMVVAAEAIQDPRWEKTPKLHNNIIKDKDVELTWRFRDQPYDKAEVTVIHAPPDLHYEYSVVSEDVQLHGPEKDLRVYYHHFVGRVKVTYHQNLVSVKMSKCVPEDAGEVFVQVNFAGSVPLTSSTFVSVYKEPDWVPNSILSESMKGSVWLSLSLENTELCPPIDRVIVRFHKDLERPDDDNRTMVITPPRNNSGLEIRCQPSAFYEDLRYTGGSDLHQLQFTIPQMDQAKEGYYTINVVYGTINEVLSHTIKVEVLADIPSMPEAYITTTGTYGLTGSESTPHIEECSKNAVIITLYVLSLLGIAGTLGALISFLRLKKRHTQLQRNLKTFEVHTPEGGYE